MLNIHINGFINKALTIVRPCVILNYTSRRIMKTVIHFGTDHMRLCVPYGEKIPVGLDSLESSEMTCKACIKALKEEREDEMRAEGMMS
jgi:hypothetical protein